MLPDMVSKQKTRVSAWICACLFLLCVFTAGGTVLRDRIDLCLGAAARSCGNAVAEVYSPGQHPEPGEKAFRDDLPVLSSFLFTREERTGKLAKLAKLSELLLSFAALPEAALAAAGLFPNSRAAAAASRFHARHREEYQYFRLMSGRYPPQTEMV